jgi:hypothetical protein
MRFFDRKAVKFLGHEEVFDPPSVTPHWAMGVVTATDQFWIYTSLAKAFGILDGTHGDITRSVGGDYSAGAALGWNGGVLGGIPVINNGVDIPQYWPTIQLATTLADLTNWPAAERCRVMRPFLNFLIALNIDKGGGTLRPHMVKWSHSADPGTLPDSWDETDATKDAGEAELTDVQSGVILDGLSLGRVFLIYKASSTHLMRFIGGNFIWAFDPIPTLSGILDTQCVVLVPSGGRRPAHHFVATGDDVVIHDGRTPTSVVEDRQRKFIFNSIDTDNANRSFCFSNREFRECWFCFPEKGSTIPTLAAVWSMDDNVTTIREMPGDISFITSGKIIESTPADIWDSDANTWDSDATKWDSVFSPAAADALACDPTNTKLYQLDRTEQFNGTAFTAYLERIGLAIVGRDRQGNPKVDFERRKMCTRMWPKIVGGPVNIRVGSQELLDGPVTYGTTQSFDPAVDQYLDFDPPVTGRLIAVRFETSLNVSWELHGYDLEVKLLGEF